MLQNNQKILSTSKSIILNHTHKKIETHEKCYILTIGSDLQFICQSLHYLRQPITQFTQFISISVIIHLSTPPFQWEFHPCSNSQMSIVWKCLSKKMDALSWLSDLSALSQNPPVTHRSVSLIPLWGERAVFKNKLLVERSRLGLENDCPDFNWFNFLSILY